jgi:hypothetical protein
LLLKQTINLDYFIDAVWGLKGPPFEYTAEVFISDATESEIYDTTTSSRPKSGYVHLNDGPNYAFGSLWDSDYFHTASNANNACGSTTVTESKSSTAIQNTTALAANTVRTGFAMHQIPIPEHVPVQPVTASFAHPPSPVTKVLPAGAKQSKNKKQSTTKRGDNKKRG